MNPRSGRMAWIDSRDGLGTVHIADLDGSNVSLRRASGRANGRRIAGGERVRS